MSTPFDECITRLTEKLRSEALTLAAVVGATEHEARRSLVEALRQREGRGISWRCRLRLYSADTLYESPIADTMGDAEPELPGNEVFPTLPAVVRWMHDHASDFHGADCFGLNEMTLKNKMGKIYNQLSLRGDGQAVLLADYTVRGQRWRARVDLVRDDMSSPRGKWG